MPEVSGGRTDQLGDFVAMLKFRTIDLDYRARVAHQAFRRSFHHARLAGTRGSQEKEIADRSSGAGHAGQVSLIDADDLLDGLVLAHNAFVQIGVQLLGLQPGLCWIELPVHAPHLSYSLHIYPSSTLDARAEGGTNDHFAGRDGRISTRLTMVRDGMRNTMDTASATSSGAIIQLVSADLGFPGVPENSVSTLPGMMELTRTLSWR